ncbi:MAG: hypothetical protein OER95_00010 [Acidimicrobiia bacterium]|nr:hypothetical protein [Acidimicrobiia bacterium]
MAMIIGVRALPADGTMPFIAALVLGLAIVPLVGSVLEWFVHRFVYHEAVVPILAPIFTVHTAHHYSFFPTWRYVTRGPARRLAITRRAPDIHTSTGRNAGVRLAHFGWYMAIGVVLVWIPAWLATGNSAFLIGIVISSIVVSNLFIVVHDTIHRPGSHRLVEAQPWFGFLDRHHYVHHVDLGANLNFLLPLADLLFGSLRTQMTQDEIDRHGTLGDAKSHPIGEGERARNAVVG